MNSRFYSCSFREITCALEMPIALLIEVPKKSLSMSLDHGYVEGFNKGKRNLGKMKSHISSLLI